LNSADIQLCRQWADLYRLRGFNPLPSRTDAKRPLCRFAQWWEEPAPASLFERFKTTNVQVMCGRAWKLLVIDLDSWEARDRWRHMGRSPRTWTSHSGGGGRHLWFRLGHAQKPMSKTMLWKGEGAHQAIERLCDHSLVMAPPSIHPTTGERYRFESKAESPLGMALPADCPGWVLRLRPAVSPTLFLSSQESQVGREASTSTIRPALRVATQASNQFDRAQVLDAIPNKLELARSWGVRLAGRPNAKGWAPCHAIDRDDVHPSAAIHQESGSYVDHGSGTKLSLFDLGASLGIYSDWKEAINQLGEVHARR